MLSLYYYTNAVGLAGIIAERRIHPSTLARNPRDVRHGPGQYFSDIAPGQLSSAQLSRVFLGQPFQGRRFTHYLEVDVQGLVVVLGRPGVYVVPGEKPLNLSGRIIRSGAIAV